MGWVKNPCGEPIAIKKGGLPKNSQLLFFYQKFKSAFGLFLPYNAIRQGR